AEAPGTEMVVLFGSHARGDWVEDHETGYQSDYDLLEVVESAEMAEDHRLWARVEEAVRPIEAPAPVALLVHGLRELTQEIRRAQVFCEEVWEQGLVLYDSRRFTVARPKAATPDERKALAEEYFEHWFTSAGRFFIQHGEAAARGWNPEAAFELHQATERY